MDFFDHQDQARRKTGQLVFAFVLGVLVTAVLVNLLGFGIWLLLQGYSGSGWSGSLWTMLQDWLFSPFAWQLALGTLLVIGAGSLAAYWQLRQGGGEVVARWSGARPVDYEQNGPAVQQFINVSEEMAIAAGTPVPSLYVMEHEGAINAFVAGYLADQAVLVVSRGALDTLSRDELQGVIGHEFSHILNGDMRLNIRLMAVLAGLVQIGQAGRWMWGFMRVGYRSSRRGRSDAALAILGLALMVVGYVGVLTARVIKAGVSRQREYLADASSVQFTRNPDGIAGALYKIREHAQGSQLLHRHAEDMSHFCFGESVALSSMMATHPPLGDRIRRVNPSFMARARHRGRASEPADSAVARTAPDAFDQVMGVATLGALAGTVRPDHIEYARQLYKNIPEQVRHSVHQSAGARAFCYSQIMLASPGHEQALLNLIKQEDAPVVDVLRRFWSFYQKLDVQLRLPLLDMAIPVLKRLSERERLVFLDRLDRMANLDETLALREWVLLAQVRHHLSERGAPWSQHTRPFKECTHDLQVVLSALVHINRQPLLARAAYEQAMQPFDVADKSLLEPEKAGFAAVTGALEHLGEIAYFWRRAVLQACIDVVRADGALAQQEYELVRTVADCLGCPMPPMVEHEWRPGG
ncbi:M48 family metallopeptidase [Saccharospirillum impatiens]|uniref:M48 family metallopeptidase n=1 Tax=Saccharospirillum impatiens TaxID=169438 RepID=UPI000412F44C|nr:M48 family metallopeptidase [Saccharospirillum impatiens]